MSHSLGSNQQSPMSTGWRRQLRAPSLQEAFRTIPVPVTGPGWFGFFRKLLAFTGPGYLIAVGYMDPGNWATDLAGGSLTPSFSGDNVPISQVPQLSSLPSSPYQSQWMSRPKRLVSPNMPMT